MSVASVAAQTSEPMPTATINSTSDMPRRRLLIDVILQSIMGNQSRHLLLMIDLSRSPVNGDRDELQVGGIGGVRERRVGDVQRAGEQDSLVGGSACGIKPVGERLRDERGL